MDRRQYNSAAMETQNKSAVVIGAGLVGCSCALWLQKKGFSVTLVDPEDPGSGTSYGNACTIAEYACVPINSPDLFRRLPSLIFSRESPLSLDPLYTLTHPLWMINFLLNCRKEKVARIIRLLAGLLIPSFRATGRFLHVFVPQHRRIRNNLHTL